jgi:adenylosuccinate synthase
MPTHRALDHAYENAKGDNKIGSTKKGIGPTYTDKIARNGLRIGDIFNNFEEKYQKLKAGHLEILKHYEYEFDIEAYEIEWKKGIEVIKQFSCADTEYLINNYLSDKKAVLAEGAQGTLLDVEFGSYPFVTSSNTIAAGACTGLGVAPNRVGEVFGIFKAYCTRVGSGPFPTELFDETGDLLQQKGREVGATTGRKRRCGWLDLPALKYSIMLNGVTQLIVTKIDVMSEFETVKVATGYQVDGKTIDYLPFNDSKVVPIFKEFKGWSEDLTGITTYDKLPQAVKEYLNFVEEYVKVPITIVSVGPGRTETICK